MATLDVSDVDYVGMGDTQDIEVPLLSEKSVNTVEIRKEGCLAPGTTLSQLLCLYIFKNMLAVLLTCSLCLRFHHINCN